MKGRIEEHTGFTRLRWIMGSFNQKIGIGTGFIW